MADNNYKILDDCEVQVKKLHSIVKEMELAQTESKRISFAIKSFHELGILPNSSTKEDAEKIAFDLNRVIGEVSRKGFLNLEFKDSPSLKSDIERLECIKNLKEKVEESEDKSIGESRDKKNDFYNDKISGDKSKKVVMAVQAILEGTSNGGEGYDFTQIGGEGIYDIEVFRKAVKEINSQLSSKKKFRMFDNYLAEMK